jgi:hypothetical protein
MVQTVRNIFEIICSNLNPDGGVGRTQKQKALKQFVNVSSRLKPFVFQMHFKNLAVVYIFEYRHIDPWLCFSPKEHNSIIPVSTELLFTRCLVFLVVLHKLLTGLILQASRERVLLQDTKAISETNFLETQATHLMVLFISQTSRPFLERVYSSKCQKHLRGNKSKGSLVLHINGTSNKWSQWTTAND